MIPIPVAEVPLRLGELGRKVLFRQGALLNGNPVVLAPLFHWVHFKVGWNSSGLTIRYLVLNHLSISYSPWAHWGLRLEIKYLHEEVYETTLKCLFLLRCPLDLFSVSDYKGTLILDPLLNFTEPNLGLMDHNLEHHLSGQSPSDLWDLMPDASGLARDAVKYNGTDQTNISQALTLSMKSKTHLPQSFLQ